MKIMTTYSAVAFVGQKHFKAIASIWWLSESLLIFFVFQKSLTLLSCDKVAIGFLIWYPDKSIGYIKLTMIMLCSKGARMESIFSMFDFSTWSPTMTITHDNSCCNGLKSSWSFVKKWKELFTSLAI